MKIEMLDYEILKAIQRIAVKEAHKMNCGENLYYDLASAAAKLRMEVYPSPGVVAVPGLKN